eukprot:SAG11_NODE_8065_length_1063_cov_14.488589_1_plen_126_part_00
MGSSDQMPAPAPTLAKSATWGFLDSPSRATVVLSACGAVTVAMVGGAWPFISPAFRRHVLPFIPASDQQVNNVLRAIKYRPQGSRFVDLGSGDGRITIAAAKAGFVADGIELNPWLTLYSRCVHC